LLALTQQIHFFDILSREQVFSSEEQRLQERIASDKEFTELNKSFLRLKELRSLVLREGIREKECFRDESLRKKEIVLRA
jgi:hypothetical protein